MNRASRSLFERIRARVLCVRFSKLNWRGSQAIHSGLSTLYHRRWNRVEQFWSSHEAVGFLICIEVQSAALPLIYQSGSLTVILNEGRKFASTEVLEGDARNVRILLGLCV